MMSNSINSRQFGEPSQSDGVQERLARVRAAVTARDGGRGGPGPIQFFKKHHSDWGGFMNAGEIAR